MLGLDIKPVQALPVPRTLLGYAAAQAVVIFNDVCTSEDGRTMASTPRKCNAIDFVRAELLAAAARQTTHD